MQCVKDVAKCCTGVAYDMCQNHASGLPPGKQGRRRRCKGSLVVVGYACDLHRSAAPWDGLANTPDIALHMGNPGFGPHSSAHLQLGSTWPSIRDTAMQAAS